MAVLVGEHIESLVPYAPGKPIEEVERELGIEGCIKLASNENPLGPSPRAMEAVREAASKLHYYPDGGAYYLKRALSDRLGVGLDELVIGNGSNELLVCNQPQGLHDLFALLLSGAITRQPSKDKNMETIDTA